MLTKNILILLYWNGFYDKYIGWNWMITISRFNIAMLWICGSFLLIFEDTWQIIGIEQCKILYFLYALLIIKLTILQIKMRKAALNISDDDAQTNERFQTFTALVNGILILL